MSVKPEGHGWKKLPAVTGREGSYFYFRRSPVNGSRQWYKRDRVTGEWQYHEEGELPAGQTFGISPRVSDRDPRPAKGGATNRGGGAMTATQECRACATHFPYSEDADYCPTCAAENAGYETLAARLERLAQFIYSTRYALTEDDVRHDYETGRHRYAR